MNGSLIIDKPAGMTSHDVVSKVRRAARTRRVGHAGTLDPFATGVLVVCIGLSTRLVQFIIGLDKQYIATVRLGFATDTQDLTGKQITPLRSSNRLSEDEVRETLLAMTGPQMQLPPMYSAKKVGGERLHRAARAGREVEREPVPITVHSIELLADHSEWLRQVGIDIFDFDIRVRCSSGTYVRTLAHDIGERLSTGAHLAVLRRTALGRFDIASAISLEEIERLGDEDCLRQVMLTPSETVAHLPMIELDDKQVEMVLHGRAIDCAENDWRSVSGQMLRLCDRRGNLVAVGVCDLSRKGVKPRVVFNLNS